MRQVSPVLVIPSTPSSAMVDVLGNAFAYVDSLPRDGCHDVTGRECMRLEKQGVPYGDCVGPTGPAT